MIITNLLMTETFLTWCDLYFGDELLLPRFEVTKWYNRLGRVEIPSNDINNTTIFMSGEYDYTQRQLDSIMVHEMIHYYLYVTGRDTRCSHGKEFMKMANEINSKFGLEVKKYVDLRNYTLRKDYSKIRKFFSFLEIV